MTRCVKSDDQMREELGTTMYERKGAITSASAMSKCG
jgi:hypothetical protein